MLNKIIFATCFLTTLSILANPPNVIFVMYDDMGYGEPTSFNSDSPFKTPNLDRLVAEGMKFTDAHSAAANCTPTRYGVLTGRYPFRIGQYNVLKTMSPNLIPYDRMTVASLMQKAGYHTGCVGKWHLGMNWNPTITNEKQIKVGSTLKTGPTENGFDYFCGFTHAGNIGTVIEQKSVIHKVKSVEVLPIMNDKAVAYVNERAKDGKPFFLYLPMAPPHSPHVPAPEFKGKTNKGNYGDWIYQGDWVLGQVLDALDKHKLTDNTLVIVTADNGAAGKAYKPFRGAKKSAYEGGHREPFVARWPAKIKAGSTCHTPISLNDLMATCAQLVDIKIPDTAGEDSVSILPLLEGKNVQLPRKGLIQQSSFGDMVIRQGPWKLLVGKTGDQELYNLDNDLSETKDLLTTNPEKAKELYALMVTCFKEGRTSPGAPQKNSVDIHPGDTAKFRTGSGSGMGSKKKK